MTARAQALHGAPDGGLSDRRRARVRDRHGFDEGSAEPARGVDHLVHEAWSTDPADPAAWTFFRSRCRARVAQLARRLVDQRIVLDDHDAILADARRVSPAALGEDGVELLGADG